MIVPLLEGKFKSTEPRDTKMYDRCCQVVVIQRYLYAIKVGNRTQLQTRGYCYELSSGRFLGLDCIRKVKFE